MWGDREDCQLTHIERIEVEHEGFLGGLDVTMSPGLNVLIGARGAGKTSLIELIRYALGAGAFTTDAETKGEQQAVATLDGGAVTLTLRDGDQRWTITRTADGVRTSNHFGHFGCTVLAQNEVESIGISPAGRLGLIDRFLPSARQAEADIQASAATVVAVTRDIATALAELNRADEALSGLPALNEELAAARSAQALLLGKAKASSDDQQVLTDAQARLGTIVERQSQLEYADTAIRSLKQAAVDMRARVMAVGADMARLLTSNGSAAHTQSAATLLEGVERELSAALDAIRTQADGMAEERADLDETSRSVRQRLDATQEGISQATRQVLQLEERKGQLDAVQSRRVEFVKRLEHMKDRRKAAFETLSTQRASRLEARRQVAEMLSAKLAPHIRVRARSGGKLDSYASAVIAGLRGSGLHYNNLAPQLVSAISPFELVDWVERGEIGALADAVGLTTDRAAAIVSALRGDGTAAIIAAGVEDEVDLELLDGTDYKPVEHLSIGQRCTVVLPILLALPGETLIVDQPEDHLDNAFIASTLISAIRDRDSLAQTIFSSHNANIPVLGDAERVVVMESDGESGQVIANAGLEDSGIVLAISNLLEGGAEAFAKRATFYSATGEGQ
tara:strand:+ start:8531 stop:10402 length:1872 start_codon:yes stop_codon:yes gene_type:complete